MSLLQRIIEHLQNLVLVSDTTLMLMGVSIILMSIAYFYCVIIKNNKYEKIIVIIGIVVRILMIIGFTIEFSHQKAIYQGSGVINDKYSSMEQFSNYLFYGYIFVIGIYDIFTIEINKFRGFFHAFDLTMMSIPILYALTTILLNFSFQEETLYGVIIVIVLSVLPFIFFKLYWKQNIKWYSIFFVYIVIILIVYKISAIRTFFISTLISYLLIGMYEFSRFLFDKINMHKPSPIGNFVAKSPCSMNKIPFAGETVFTDKNAK